MGRLGDVVRRLREGVGFRIDEVMSGTHDFEPGMGPPGKKPLSFRVTWGADSIARWLTPGGEFLRGPLEGTIGVEGLCEAAPCRGTLELRYFDEHAIRYAFEFETGGRRYRFVGEKVNIRPWNLPYSHTTCFGRLTEAESGRLVSTSVTHFRLLSLPRFLTSFRIVSEDGPTIAA